MEWGGQEQVGGGGVGGGVGGGGGNKSSPTSPRLEPTSPVALRHNPQ